MKIFNSFPYLQRLTVTSELLIGFYAFFRRCMLKFVITVFTFLFFISSCVSPSFYEENKRINPQGWNKNDSLIFTFEITDTISPYSMYLNIRHNTDYEYANIYFFIRSVFPNGQSNIDTVEIILAEKDGRWLGKGFGKLKENTVLLQRKLEFPMAGEYEFIFIQAMRSDNLKGVEDLGIRLNKAPD